MLQGIVTLTNNQLSPAPYIANFDFQNPTLNATTVYFEPYFIAGTGGSAVPLPAAKIFGLIIQNIGGLGNLTVTITPFGGAASPITLAPGGVFIYFDPTENGQGISAVTLTGIGLPVSAFVLAGA